MERIGEWLPFSKDMYLRKLYQYHLSGTDWERLVPSPSEAVVSVAPFGGPIAAAGATGSGPIHIFTASGRLLRIFHCPLDLGSVVACGWSKEESLLVLTSKLCVLVYEWHASNAAAVSSSNSGNHASAVTTSGPTSTFRLSAPGAPPQTLMCFAIRPSGLLVVLANGDSVASLDCINIEERKDPTHTKIPSAVSALAGLKGCHPTAIEYLPNDVTEEDEALAYIGTSADKRTRCGTIVVVHITQDTTTDTRARIPGGVLALRIDPTNEQIAILAGTGTVSVSPLNLESARLVLHLGVSVAPKFFDWAGPRFLSLTYSETHFDEYYSDASAQLFTVMLAADESGSADIKFERLNWDQDGSGWCCVAQEVDGIRVVTDTHYMFIEDVPRAIVDLCQLKPTSDVGRFATAYRQMSGGTVNGLTAIREMVHKLGSRFESNVIESLLDAALGEFTPSQQEKILGAAADAKSRCNGFDAERYVDVVRRLRALNALRNRQNGFPLSTKQYAYLSGSEHLRTLSPSEMQVVLDRLVNRGDYQLAFDISSALKQRSQKILVQWSCALVQNRSVDDATLSQTIAKVMSLHPGASYVEAARAASNCGRQTLAIYLLQNEKRAQQQVLLLMQMAQEDLALQKAFESDEVDLIVMVLIKLVAQRTEQQILNALGAYPLAQQWLAAGSLYVGIWWAALKRYWEDAHKQHLIGFEVLHRALLNDRETTDTVDAAVTPAPPPAPVSSTGSDRRDGRQRHEAALDASEEEVDAYDQLEDLREATDDDEDAPPVKRGKDFETKFKGLFGGKKQSEVPPLKSGNKSSKSSAAADVPPQPLPSALALSVPGKRRIAGSTAITTDDMIDVCRYFAPNGPCDMEGRWCRNHMALLEEQRLLASDTGNEDFMNQSVMQTIEMCYQYDKDKAAEGLMKKFHVSEKKFVYAKLRALCAAHRWSDVDQMFGAAPGVKSKSLRSPIGFLPVVMLLHRHDRQQQAVQYVPRLEDVCVRVDWFVKLDCFQAAIDAAFNEESPDLIQQILKKAQNPSIVAYGQAKMKELQ